MKRGSDCPRWDDEKRANVPCGHCEWCAFRLALCGVFGGYPASAMSEFTIASYWKQLHPFDYNVVEEALAAAVHDCRDFPPTASRIAEAAQAIARRRAKRSQLCFPQRMPTDDDAQRVREILAALDRKLELK